METCKQVLKLRYMTQGIIRVPIPDAEELPEELKGKRLWMKAHHTDPMSAIKSVTVMVQKEVAERMQAGPGGKDYGALTLLVRYYSEAEVIANVPPNSFIPRPGVDSAVIKLSLLKKPRIETEDPGRLFAIIRAAFSQRRKTLSNALKNDAALKIPREKTEAALETMGLKTDIRGERLSLEEFAELSRLIR